MAGAGARAADRLATTDTESCTPASDVLLHRSCMSPKAQRMCCCYCCCCWPFSCRSRATWCPMLASYLLLLCCWKKWRASFKNSALGSRNFVKFSRIRPRLFRSRHTANLSAAHQHSSNWQDHRHYEQSESGKSALCGGSWSEAWSTARWCRQWTCGKSCSNGTYSRM